MKVHLHHFSKIKSQKEVTKQKKSRFFLLFLLGDRRIRILSRIRLWIWFRIQEARRTRIRIRILNTDDKQNRSRIHLFPVIYETVLEESLKADPGKVLTHGEKQVQVLVQVRIELNL
jgi:hypothetical protein